MPAESDLAGLDFDAYGQPCSQHRRGWLGLDDERAEAFARHLDSLSPNYKPWHVALAWLLGPLITLALVVGAYLFFSH